jgi:hypothetical protein
MSELMDNFRKKFKIADFTIYETDYWIWSLRPVQATLGSSIFICSDKFILESIL